MERIECQVAEQTELAKQALAFLICAKRPLSTLELQEAMGVEVDELELDPENYPTIEDIMASCLGLVTIDEDSKITQLVHNTTQEYLKRTLDRWFPNAEAMIADVCISYLCLNRHTDPTHLDPTEDSTWYAYAAKNWAHHARRAPSSSKRVVDFLTQEIPLSKSFLYIGYRWQSATFVYNRLSNKEAWTTGLHLAAEFGLEDVTVALLLRGSDTSRRDVYGRTPLIVAAEMGSKATFEQLLKHGSSIETRIDERHDDLAGYTALHVASRNGHTPIVRLLLTAGADVNSQGCDDDTPISSAVSRGQTEVVRVLIDAKADMTLHTTGKMEWDSMTLLGIAIVRGHIDTVQLLITAGVDVNERDKGYRGTALFYAAAFHSIDCVRILIEAGADPNLPAGYLEEAPLMTVCYGLRESRKHSIPIIKMLLDARADINYISSNGLTAYEIAKRKKDSHVTEYLLERGADLELGLNGRLEKDVLM